MPLPSTLNVALKEWAVVCAAVARGRQIILLRKGGISEVAGGFDVEHRQFLLFPTYLHQNRDMLKPTEQADFVPSAAEPAQVRLSAAAEVTDIVKMPSRAAMDALDDRHIWTPPLIDMRYNYRPKNPLFLLLVRAYRLDEAVVIDNTPQYAGCKSWVPLGREIAVGRATPALSDEQYRQARAEIRARIQAAQ